MIRLSWATPDLPPPAPPLPSQGARVVAKLGGVRKAQRMLGHRNATTVQGWKERGWIPAKHHERLIEVARAHGVALSVSDFIPDPARQDEGAA